MQNQAQPTIQNIRLLCQTREMLRDMLADGKYQHLLGGFLALVRYFRLQYIKHSGLKRYLADTLGQHGGTPVARCTIYKNGCEIKTVPEETGLIKYLAACFDANTLPDRIELVSNNGKLIEVCI